MSRNRIRSIPRTAVAIAAVGLAGVTGLGVAAARSDDAAADRPARTAGIEDQRGPCDEAEHANDPACGTGTTLAPPASTTVPVTAAPDLRGPCDEAEHANDPRCAGVVPGPVPVTPRADVDLRGPCDEAEHANDPRCTPTAPATVEDHSGRDSVEDESGHDDADGDDSGHGEDSGHGGDSGRDRDSGHGGDDSGHHGGDD